MEDKVFNEIQRRFNELIFEIQLQDNKKVIEFQEKFISMLIIS